MFCWIDPAERDICLVKRKILSGNGQHVRMSQSSKTTVASKATVVKEGVVLEALPNTTFRVQLDEDKQLVLAMVSGKMRRFFIKIWPGDRVQVEFSPHDLSLGRITYRYKS